jgi:hypothetical protein
MTNLYIRHQSDGGKELPTLTEVQGASGYREQLCEFVQSQGVELNEDIRGCGR